jgi:hypothetical protein
MAMMVGSARFVHRLIPVIEQHRIARAVANDLAARAGERDDGGIPLAERRCGLKKTCRKVMRGSVW